MNLVSLLIATSVVKYSSNVGLRTGVALGAVIIIVGAIVWSKRRAHSMGDEDETPASAEISGATSAAASVGSPDAAEPATVAVPPVSAVPPVPPVRPGGEANGQVASGSPAPADPTE